MSTFMKSMKCASVLVAMSVGAVSCIDEAYDLSNGIDTTVTVEGNISAPIGSTAFMYVGDFLNLDEENSALVKNENGDYVLNVEGDGTHSATGGSANPPMRRRASSTVRRFIASCSS